MTRVALPAVIVLSALGLIAYAARESFRPTMAVTVAPVVLRAGGAGGGGGAAAGEVVQAPGWIEADPNAISVPALEPGVIKELLVLDGQRVEAGQVVATLVDDEARIEKTHAEAAIDRNNTRVAEAVAAQKVREALAEEARDYLRRVAPLGGTGALPETELAARRLRVETLEAEVALAKAAVTSAISENHVALQTLEMADLALTRLTVRAPVAGVVLQRMAEPGQRLMPDANNPFAGVVVRLYDPAHLQVRVDVPLADAAKVREGDEVEVTTETLPGRVFKAKLTRFVHEANIQKNTVQVKAAIIDPAPELKPDMLAKALITTRPAQSAAGNAMPGMAMGMGEEVLMAPRAAIVDLSGQQGAAWVLDRQTSTAVKRTVHLGRITAESVEVHTGLQPGDRVIVNPPADLRAGAKVKVIGEGGAK